MDPGATASSGLPVTYSVTSGPCTVVSGLIHPTAVGACRVVASQPGNDNWNAAANVAKSLVVTAEATTTVLTAPATAPVGSQIQLTATVSSTGSTVNGGVVQFYTAQSTIAGQATVVSGVATFFITAPSSATTLRLHAVYVPDPSGSNWSKSTSAVVPVKVS